MPVACRPMLLLMPLLGAPALHAQDAAPQLYRQPLYEAPVSAGAGELLLLGGAGLGADLRVRLGRAGRPEQGLEEVHADEVPDALVVRMPADLSPGEAVVLTVVSPSGAASVTVNERRPAWVTPGRIPATGTLAYLPRELRVVGRNLRSVHGGADRLVLSGPARYELPLAAPPPDDRAFSQHVAVAALPAELVPGRYAASLLRNGEPAVGVPGSVEVVADPAPLPVLDVAERGCRPDDAIDDTACLAAALAAAAQRGGGEVRLGAGRWELGADAQGSGGLLLPAGVSLRGAGATQTQVRRHPRWRTGTAEPTFTLLGRNRVEGIAFIDLRPHRAGDPKSPTLRLGAFDDGAGERPATSDLVITRSAFEQSHPAIAAGGVPLSRVTITFNAFGAWSQALHLSGNRFNVRRPFALADTTVRFNLFQPGAYLDVAARQGAIASEIGASERVDFSDNVADGASTAHLPAPRDGRGWRAAFFWHLNNSHEHLLIARNQVSCPGDRIGDGEAIALDNNANTFALAQPARVQAAGPDWVEIDSPLAARQEGQPLDPQRFYVGHWMQVVRGPGLGQSRRITAITPITPGASARLRIAVDPPWDAVPTAAHISISRLFWQALVIDNVIDQRQPLCAKGNRSDRRGGQIAFWAPTSASTVQGNVQYDTDGIVYQQSYRAADKGCRDCTMQAWTQYFLDIRGNRVDGEYDWNSDCSASGIQGSHSAAREGVPPTVAFGVNIASNRVRQADGLRGGAISLPLTWQAGPEGGPWTLVRGTVIQANRIQDNQGAGARRVCGGGDGEPRAGIVLSPSGLLGPVLVDANRCERVGVGLRERTRSGVARCTAGRAADCGCAP